MNSPYSKPAASSGSGGVTTDQVNSLVNAAITGKADKPTDVNPSDKVATFDASGNLVVSNKSILEIGMSTSVINNDTTVIVQQVNAGTYISSGGSCAWVSGLTYRVGASVYKIDGTEYTSEEGEVTLGDADATNPRIDVIAFDTNGHIVVIPGTAASDPAQPDVDPTLYCMITFVFLSALATAPDVTSMAVYEEGAEWTVTASHASVVKDSTNSPRTGSKCIEGTDVAAGRYFNAVKSGTFDVSLQNTLVLYVKKKAAWPSTRTISLQWRRGSTTVGNSVVVVNGSYGFQTASFGTYEQVVVPIKAFNIPTGTLVDRIRVTFSGTGANVGFYLDDFMLQAGTVITANPGMTWRGTWSSTSAYVRNDVVERSGRLYICNEANVNLAPETYAVYWTAMTVAVPSVTAVPIGHLSGLVVTRKDDDEVYVSGGSVEVGEVLLNSDERLTLSLPAVQGWESPTMSSANTPSPYVVSAHEEYSTDYAWKAMNHDSNTPWQCYNAGVPIANYGWWKIYVGESPICVNLLTIKNAGLSSGFHEFKLQGSNDDNNWTDIYSGHCEDNSDIQTYNQLGNSNYYNYYRLWCVSSYQSNGLMINEISMSGIYEIIPQTQHVYIDPPTIGTEIATENLVLSTDAPIFDSAKGGYYHPTNTDQRAIAYFTTTNVNCVPTSIYMYPSVPLPIDTDSTMTADSDSVIPSQKAVKAALADKADIEPHVVSMMLLDKDVAIAIGTNLGNVQFPVPSEWNGLTITDISICISPLGTASSSGNIDFSLTRTRGATEVDVIGDEYTAITIPSGSKVSNALDEYDPINNGDLETGDFLALDCESAGTGAKGPLWLKITAE